MWWPSTLSVGHTWSMLHIYFLLDLFLQENPECRRQNSGTTFLKVPLVGEASPLLAEKPPPSAAAQAVPEPRLARSVQRRRRSKRRNTIGTTADWGAQKRKQSDLYSLICPSTRPLWQLVHRLPIATQNTCSVLENGLKSWRNKFDEWSMWRIYPFFLA